MQPHPAVVTLHEVILNSHPERGTHAGEGVDHQANQRAIAQSGERIRVFRPANPMRRAHFGAHKGAGRSSGISGLFADSSKKYQAKGLDSLPAYGF